jgi:excisionase family DNA binding protein
MKPAAETPPPEHKTIWTGVQDRPIRALNNPQDEMQDCPQDSLDKITVAEAAERLGVSQDAVRKRIARGTIRHGKGEDGRIFVYLTTFERASKTVQDEPPEQPSKTGQDAVQDKYTRSLEDQIAFLRQELERKDAILMSLAQRIPELEASSELQENPEIATEDADRGDVPQQPREPSQQRSWLSRFFFGP